MGRAKRTELDAPVGWVEGKAWDHSLLSWGEEVHARNGANRLIAKFAAEWHGRQAVGRRSVAFAASALRDAEAVAERSASRVGICGPACRFPAHAQHSTAGTGKRSRSERMLRGAIKDGGGCGFDRRSRGCRPRRPDPDQTRRFAARRRRREDQRSQRFVGPDRRGHRRSPRPVRC